jgi:hypothetical protein
MLLFRTGPTTDDARLVVLPLAYRSSETLIPSLGSRLAVFQKEEHLHVPKSSEGSRS